MKHDKLLEELKYISMPEWMKEEIKEMATNPQIIRADACPYIIRENLYYDAKSEKYKMHSIRCDYSDNGDYTDNKETIERWLGK